MRISWTLEGMELKEGVNLSSGIHFDYVNILRYEGERKAVLMRVVMSKDSPGCYSFYEETWIKIGDTGLGDWECQSTTHGTR